VNLRGQHEYRPVTGARDFLTALVAIGATVQLTSAALASYRPDIQGPPAIQSAGNVTTTRTTDPAAVTFATDVGMVLHVVKPGSASDYETALVALQDAFSKSSDEEVKRVAAGWRVWKAAEADAQGNVVYVHTLLPTTPEVDYRPSLWLDRLLSGAPADLLAKYRDSFAVAPGKLSLTEFANMSVAPVTPVNPTPPKPGNSSPR
jgi:hypothetical protein